jgi:hypothetical protein
MNQKYNLLLLIFGFFMLFLLSCTNQITQENNLENTSSLLSKENASSDDREYIVDKLEIFHFHGTNQCYSCVTVGDYAKETLDEFFSKEIEEGIIEFKHINAELPENRDLVMKYGATGSSIWIGTYVGDEFTAEQNVNVWYKINDNEIFKEYFKGFVEEKLFGK